MRIARVIAHDWLRNVVMLVDYVLYVLVSPFKFKSFPKVMRRIVAVELLGIGDVLVVTPALRALKERFPKARLDVVASPNGAVALKGNPHVDDVIICDGDVSSLVARLRERQYDLGVLFHPGSLRVSYALWRGGVKYRVGCTTDVGITYGKGFFLHKKVRPCFRWRHKREDNLAVVEAIGATTTNKKLEMRVNSEARRRISNQLNMGGDTLAVVIHAGSAHQTQRWYPGRFALVADTLMADDKTMVVFTGSRDDQAVVEEILKRMRKHGVNMAGKTTFEEFVALIDLATMVLSVDASAVHIASALDKPVVALFGPTLPERWILKSQKNRVIQNNNVCTGCRRYQCLIKTHECMKSIRTGQVIRALRPTS